MRILQRLATLFRPAEERCFFPPATPLERDLMCQTFNEARGDERRMLELTSHLSSRKLAFTTFTYELTEREAIIHQAGSQLVFPRPIPRVKFTLLVSGYRRWLERKYTLPGFCEVEAGERVVDCGAYIGGFGLNALGMASHVHFFEPDPQNYACLSQNISHAKGATAHQVGLHRQTGILRFNRSASSVEHSFLTPDDGEPVGSIDVNTIRLEDFAKNEGIDGIEFLKIEAEGVEIEVFEGAGDLPIQKIAVDVSPERDGESPRGYFEKTLTNRGYEVRVRQNVLFARRTS